MKKRIVALILAVVMSLLALTSCGSFNFAEEDLTSYATFDYEAFKTALGKIEIEDGEFTTNEDTRAKLVAAKIYNTIADKVIAATKEDEQLKKGELTEGDVLYFVYYAVDADGNVFFGSDMDKASITTSSSKANHVIKLDDHFDEDEKFLSLIKENLQKVDIEEYIYSMLGAKDLTSDTLKIKAEDVIVISYTRTYKVKDAEGVETEVKEVAAYETIDLSNNLLASYLLKEGSLNAVGANFEIATGKDDSGKVTTSKSFDVVDGDKTYTYSNVKILWKVEKAGKPIAEFKYTPYELEEGKKKEVTPDSLYTSGKKVDLANKELTYYVYPVYAIDAPSYEEITATDILYHVYGSKLTSSSFEVLGEEGYKNGETKLEDLLKEVTNIFDTKSETNEYYKEGGALYELNKAYNDAVTAGGSKPTDEQKKTIENAQTALTDKQNELLKEVIVKIAAATNGTKTVGDEVVEEYKHNTEHSLKETYDADIQKKVQTAVWNLINDSVKLTGEYPEKLLKEYVDHLYEHYEYEFYKGDFSSSVKNYDKYEGSFDAYLTATLKLKSIDELDAALEKEAKGYIDTIIKLYVVAKACEKDALAVMADYVEADIAGGAYHVDEESYKDVYGDKAAEKIEEAKKSAEENIEAARKEASVFIIDDAFMKSYKKEIGRAYYNELISEYGEINLRAAFQFNKLFYYLTSTNIALNEDGDHTEVVYKDGKIDFRTITYTIKVDSETDAK